MKTSTIWGIALGAGIPGVLILLGLLVFLIKFCVRRSHRQAWDDIIKLPEDTDSTQTTRYFRKTPRNSTGDRQQIFNSNSNHQEASNNHISIPIDPNDLPPAQRELERTKQHEHTLVQLQRERLNRLKEQGHQERPMIHASQTEEEIQHAIDEAQRGFDQSVMKSSMKTN